MSMECLLCKEKLSYSGSINDGAYCPTSGAYQSVSFWTTSDGRYTTNSPGSCKECYVKARDKTVELERKNEELERKNEELKVIVDFLRLSSPSSHDDPIARSSPLSSDVTLVASDDLPDAPIPANKLVLANRSPVFKAMLETAMEESISGTIKISDVTYDLLHVFVNYLYTADVCLDEKIASNLLVLAEKYQVKHLNELCQRYLMSNLNWDNSLSKYVFARQHSAGILLEASLSIITDDIDKFMNRDEYGELVKKDPSSVVGIFEAYAKKQVNIAAKKGSAEKGSS
ncbi:hypothetical protein Dimus_024107 [Dionaea muscipula]